MIDLQSEKFQKLSKESKLLILYAISTDQEIFFNSEFCNLIELKYPDEELMFIRFLKEIESNKIKYKLEKIKFIPPKIEEIEKFLTIMKNRLKKTLTLAEIKHFSLYFFEFYEKNNWKQRGKKMTNWKQQLIFAANTWRIDYSKKSQINSMDMFDEFQESINRISVL